MADFLTIFIAAVVTHNLALTYILGMCPFISLSGSLKTASGMGLAVIFVVTLTAAVNWPIYTWVLVPYHSEFLSFIVFKEAGYLLPPAGRIKRSASFPLAAKKVVFISKPFPSKLTTHAVAASPKSTAVFLSS